MKIQPESMKRVAVVTRGIIERHRLETINIQMTARYWHFKAMLHRDNPVQKLRFQRALQKRANPDLSVTLQDIDQAWKEVDIPVLMLTIDPKNCTTLAALKAFDDELVRLLNRMELPDLKTVYLQMKDGAIYPAGGG